MGSQMWIRLEKLEKLQSFVGSYFLPVWDNITDDCERKDREGNVSLGHFSVEEGTFNLASTEGTCRWPLCVILNSEQLLWSAWPIDSMDINSLREVVVEGNYYFLNKGNYYFHIQEVKEDFEQGSFLVSLYGCLGDATWWSGAM